MARTPQENKNRTSVQYQQRLILILDERGLTKKDFAKEANINKEIISRGTTYGIIPSLRSLIKLADYLEKPLTYILGESDNKDFYKSNNLTTFHIRLKELIEEKGTTPAKLSNIMQFANNSIYEWNRTGELPSLYYLKELAEHFKVSPDYLLGRTDDRN